MTKPSSSVVRETLHSPLLVLGFIATIVVYNYYTDFLFISRQLVIQVQDNLYPVNKKIFIAEEEPEKLPFAMIGEGSNKRECDVFSGRWARDYSRPPYEESECPYIGPEFTCQKHGRPDKDYRFWKWQPHACSIPSFNATLMLEALRGKRMMFVGDSLNRGQFQSMVCLLERSIKDQRAKTMETFGSLMIFTAKDYNATIEFYWAPFLLESNADDPFKHRVTDRIIRNASVDKHGQHWKRSDILVFNTYIWWISGLRILRGSFEDKVQDVVPIDRDDAYRLSMKSLVDWVEKNVDPRRTRTFFTTMSPTHQWSYKWLGDPHGNCYNETSMLQNPNYFAAEERLMHVLTEELGKSRVPITVMNITQLTSARKDAHTSIYKMFKPRLSKEELAKNPTSHADCIHWCLPGVQDIWNELLFYKLFYP